MGIMPKNGLNFQRKLTKARYFGYVGYIYAPRGRRSNRARACESIEPTFAKTDFILTFIVHISAYNTSAKSEIGILPDDRPIKTGFY